jgi:effector-binding domain-containing protein
MTLLQTMYPDSDSYDNALTFGGFLSAACYHIGDRSNIKTTYQKIIDWCDTHHFALRGDSFERHVLDGYSVSDENQFVTEILLPFADEETVIEAQNW